MALLEIRPYPVVDTKLQAGGTCPHQHACISSHWVGQISAICMHHIHLAHCPSGNLPACNSCAAFSGLSVIFSWLALPRSDHASAALQGHTCWASAAETSTLHRAGTARGPPALSPINHDANAACLMRAAHQLSEHLLASGCRCQRGQSAGEVGRHRCCASGTSR